MDKATFQLNNLLDVKNQNEIQLVIDLGADTSDDENNDDLPRQSKSYSTSVSDQSISYALLIAKNESSDQKANCIDSQVSSINPSIDKKRQVISLKSRLQETDQNCNRLKRLINKKSVSIQQMKAKIVQKKLELRKQQADVRKIYNSYLAAVKESKENAKKISSWSSSLANMQKNVESDKELISTLETRSKTLEKQIKVGMSEWQSDVDLLPTLDTEHAEDKSLTSQHDNKNSINEASLVCPSDSRNETSTDLKLIEKPTLSVLDEINISRMIDQKLDSTRKACSYDSTAVDRNISLKLSNRETANDRVDRLVIPTTTIKKKLINKKKNALLQKMLMIEERNQKEEVERFKKEEATKLKIANEQKEKDISELKRKLKNKKILSTAIISLKKEIQNSLKTNDKIENFDFMINGLSMFLDKSPTESYILDDLIIQVDSDSFDKHASRRKSTLVFGKDSNEMIYSNNLVPGDLSPKLKATCEHHQSEEINLNTESVLESIRAYRLSNNFEERYIKENGQNFELVLDSFFSNKLDPNSILCNFDLNGKCNDDNCALQHKSDFLLDQRQKIIDLLLYNPSITRYKGEVKTKEDMNKLLQYLDDFVDNLTKKYNHNELIKYLVRLLRISDDESILIKTKVQMQNQTENTTINEYISSQQEAGGVKNTFSDYFYNFKIRDRKNVLTYEKLSRSAMHHQMMEEDNFENMYEQRFFNFDCKITNLQEYCEVNRNDVKNWIKLAYAQFDSVHCKRGLKRAQLQNAIKIVTKALDSNQTNADLWKNYLYLLINLLNNKQAADYLDKTEKQLQFVCKKILEKFPNYEIWKYYLSLTMNYLHKELISSEILDQIQSNNIVFFDKNNNRNPKLISNAYLEMVLYKTNLHIEINKNEKAERYLANILSSSIQSMSVVKTNEFIKSLFTDHSYVEVQTRDRVKYQETCLLTNEDKVFLWLNYLYLVHCGKLPTEKFELFKQGFNALTDKKPFLIKFNLVKKANLERMLGVLVESLRDCFFNIESNLKDYHYQAQEQIEKQMYQQNLIICLPLFHNLANLLHTAGKKKSAIHVFNSLSTDDNQLLVPLLVHKALFEERNNYENECFHTLGDTQVYKQDNFDVIYLLCILHFKHGEYRYFNYEVSKILTFFFEFDRSIPLSISFRKLLYRRVDLDVEKQRLLQKLDSKLWVLYLMSEVLITNEENLETVITNSISLCRMQDKAQTINFLHFLYLDFYAKTICDQDGLDEFLNKVKYSCLFIEDHQFQFCLLKHFSNRFSKVQQRFGFFLKFLILFPKNKYILNHFLNIAFSEVNSKKICYQVLKHYIDSMELRKLLEPHHWYLLIFLAIDYSDHLNVHYHIEQAISNYPYNKKLWHYALAFEVSHNHVEHCDLMRSIIKQLRIPDIEKNLDFD